MSTGRQSLGMDLGRWRLHNRRDVDETLDRCGRHVPAALDGMPPRERATARRAEGVVANGQREKRPWLVEFAGTPRAGKTTVIRSLSTWLTRAGWDVHLVDEQAECCPVPSKDNPHFNIWTTCSTICRIVEARYSSADIVLIDRGIFDALCWLEWYHQRGLPPAEPAVYESVSKFAIDLIDLVVVMIVDPAQALRRDSAGQPRSEPGTIMNARTLEAINHSIGTVAERCGGDFRLESVDTSGFTQTDTLTHVTRIVHRSRPALAAARR
jgi:thymidylate kinase